MEHAVWKEDTESLCVPQLFLHLCLFSWLTGEDKAAHPLPFILTGLWPAVAQARCRREEGEKVEKLVRRFQMKISALSDLGSAEGKDLGPTIMRCTLQNNFYRVHFLHYTPLPFCVLNKMILGEKKSQPFPWS